MTAVRCEHAEPVHASAPQAAPVIEPVIRLVASIEPSVVFTSLAVQSVVELSDDCAIDIIDGTRARYRIARSANTSAGRPAANAAGADAHVVRVGFAYPVPGAEQQPGVDEAVNPSDRFRGIAAFTWHDRTATRTDRVAAEALVQAAVHTVAWQRSDQAAHLATLNAEQLAIAVQTNRHIGTAIGILMSLHKITEEQAFELLRQTSQHSNRKLRALALEVVETGWLDPALPQGGRR